MRNGQPKKAELRGKTKKEKKTFIGEIVVRRIPVRQGKRIGPKGSEPFQKRG